jgi:ATP-binding cassette subfamily C protein
MRASTPLTEARCDLRAAVAQGRRLILFAAICSAAVNLLTLTGPIYALQIYDRVIPARSVETLAALSLLAIVLFAAMGLLDAVRTRLMAIAGFRFATALDRCVNTAILGRAADRPDATLAAAERDLAVIHGQFGSPGVLAIFDLTWSPLFLAAIFLMHPALGWLALAGGGCLIAAAVLRRVMSRRAMAGAALAAVETRRLSSQIRDAAEDLRALGMTAAVLDRWQTAGRRHLSAQDCLQAIGANLGAATRAMRLLIQSATLGLGAVLVMADSLSAGALVAAAILVGRALAPIETLLAHWTEIARAREGWVRLEALLASLRGEPVNPAGPPPGAHLEVRHLTVAARDGEKPALRDVSFTLAPGRALGVIGPSGSGKSTLARALVGARAVAAGSIRIGGKALEHYAPETLGASIGYLPQRVTLFDGSIAENVARLASGPDPGLVLEAVRRASAHQVIERLAEGFETRVKWPGIGLSGGELQRIGLARALYGNPPIVVLDEPSASLDSEGSDALNQCIRSLKAEGCCVVVTSHRPAAILECDDILVLDAGECRAFGPRDRVLGESRRNQPVLVRRPSCGRT